jgi:hypothetical protein
MSECSHNQDKSTASGLALFGVVVCLIVGSLILSFVVGFGIVTIAGSKPPMINFVVTLELITLGGFAIGGIAGLLFITLSIVRCCIKTIPNGNTKCDRVLQCIDYCSAKCDVEEEKTPIYHVSDSVIKLPHY